MAKKLDGEWRGMHAHHYAKVKNSKGVLCAPICRPIVTRLYSVLLCAAVYQSKIIEIDNVRACAPQKKSPPNDHPHHFV